ncbi:MAG TPA: DUF2177 family protein [Bdellovibrionales bacterium]|nr:DUF2177 family protein [Bdellovibrionales bacterium]
MKKRNLYLTGVLLFATLDAIWFGLIMGGFYKAELGPVLRLSEGRLDPVYWAVVLVYLLLPLGPLFLILPQTINNSAIRPFGLGAIYGLIVYGVYGATNHAVLNHWPVDVLIADATWGFFSCAAITAVLHILRERRGRDRSIFT